MYGYVELSLTRKENTLHTIDTYGRATFVGREVGGKVERGGKEQRGKGLKCRTRLAAPYCIQSRPAVFH